MSSIKVNNGQVVKLAALLQKPESIFMQGNFVEFCRFKVREIVRVGKKKMGDKKWESKQLRADWG